MIYIENVQFVYEEDREKRLKRISGIHRELQRVVVKFQYVGDKFRRLSGEIELSPSEYKASGNGKDMESVVKNILQNELHHMINKDSKCEAWGKELDKDDVRYWMPNC